ncbi:hypothetical protein Tco_0663559 [Tanacetum coccineum]
MAHALSLAKTEEEEIVLMYLGVVDDVLEPNLRAIFPALLIKVYYAMKDYLNCWELHIPDLVPLDSAYTISIHSQCFSIVNLYLYKLAITLSRLQRSVQFGTHINILPTSSKIRGYYL